MMKGVLEQHSKAATTVTVGLLTVYASTFIPLKYLWHARLQTSCITYKPQPQAKQYKRINYPLGQYCKFKCLLILIYLKILEIFRKIRTNI